MKKKNKATKIYVTIISLLMVFAMSSMTYAAITYNGTINYYSQHYGYVGYSDTKTKSDDSSAIVYYEDGPADELYVEIWASGGTSDNYANYTLRHLYNGSYVTYYVVPENGIEYVKNLVYETYGRTVDTRLHVRLYGQGAVQGKWNPSTY